MPIDIPAALRDLDRLVGRMAELVEWHKLAQQERRLPFSTSFDLNNHLGDEMRDLQICFANANMQLHELLDHSTFGISTKQRQSWLHELAQLEQRASSLVMADSFINP